MYRFALFMTISASLLSTISAQDALIVEGKLRRTARDWAKAGLQHYQSKQFADSAACFDKAIKQRGSLTAGEIQHVQRLIANCRHELSEGQNVPVPTDTITEHDLSRMSRRELLDFARRRAQRLASPPEPKPTPSPKPIPEITLTTAGAQQAPVLPIPADFPSLNNAFSSDETSTNHSGTAGESSDFFPQNPLLQKLAAQVAAPPKPPSGPADIKKLVPTPVDSAPPPPPPAPSGGAPSTTTELSDSAERSYGLPADVVERAQQALGVTLDQPSIIPDYPNLGTRRVAFAPFEINSASATNLLRVRIASIKNIDRPDRSEYVWSRIKQKGPSEFETGVDYQELRVYRETMLGSSAAFIEFPLRMVQPDVNPNSTGFGDMRTGVKSVLLEGEDFFYFPTHNNPDDKFRLGTIFNTHVSFSPILGQRGLSTGHLSLEPGVLFAYEPSPKTIFHGEMTYWMPTTGTPKFSGQVLKYAIGVSHVLASTPLDSQDCRVFAIIPTLEIVARNFLDGEETLPDGSTASAAEDAIIDMHAGFRFVLSETVEMGFSASWNVSNEAIYENVYRVELGWFY